MHPLLTTLTLALSLTLTSATTNNALPLEPRQGTASLSKLTCGSTTYTKQQVDAAVAEGCRLYAAGRQIGNSKYPHQFNNREGLVLATSGPYQEFPILSSGVVYSGKAPGPDRVVLNTNYQGACVYVGGMTHTNAQSTNGFVSCVEAAGAGSSSVATTSSTKTLATTTGTSTSTGTSTKTSSSSSGTASATANAAGGLAGVGQGVLVGVAVGLVVL